MPEPETVGTEGAARLDGDGGGREDGDRAVALGMTAHAEGAARNPDHIRRRVHLLRARVAVVLNILDLPRPSQPFV